MITSPFDVEMWRSLQCDEAFNVFIYGIFILTILMWLPRIIWSRFNAAYLKAVSRKANECLINSSLSSSQATECEDDAAKDGLEDETLYYDQQRRITFSHERQSCDNEKDDPDYLPITAVDGRGDFPFSIVNSDGPTR